MLVLTSKEIKRAEELALQKGLTHEVLMENSGKAVYDWININYNLESKRVFILAGKGNNAGDGFVLARLLAQSKFDVKITVVMCDGIVKSELAKASGNKIVSPRIQIINLNNDFDVTISQFSKLDENDIVVDAIYGTGFTAELPPLVFSIFAVINKSKATRIAIDIPSGISSDDGKIAPNTFRANITLALLAYKPAHVIEACAVYCKRIDVLDIGVPKTTLEKACIGGSISEFGSLISVELVQSILQPRQERTHKGMYGRLLNVAGSLDKSGTSIISTLAGMRVGAGFTNLATPKEVASMVAPHLMEAVVTPLPQTEFGTISGESCNKIDELLIRATVCLVGCGIGKGEGCSKVVKHIIRQADCPIIIDSDALDVVAKNVEILSSAKKQVMVTPHVGQMAKLVNRSLTDTLNNLSEIATEFATKYGVIVVMKSDNTIIVTPTEKVYRNNTGNAGLAKTGSGDMLAGIIAGLVAAGVTPENSAICGTFINGATADWLRETHSTYSMLTRDLIDTIPLVLKDLGL